LKLRWLDKIVFFAKVILFLLFLLVPTYIYSIAHVLLPIKRILISNHVMWCLPTIFSVNKSYRESTINSVTDFDNASSVSLYLGGVWCGFFWLFALAKAKTSHNKHPLSILCMRLATYKMFYT
jgi:hypothetical protein